MQNAFIIEQSMFDILKESQTPGAFDFQLTDTLELFNYDPGDLRVTGYKPEDGLYLFFQSTDFEPNMRTQGEDEHSPRWKARIYVSRGADASTVSPLAAYKAAQAVVASLYGCIRHTTFRRILRERAELSVPGIRIPRVVVDSVDNSAMFPIVENNTRSVSYWEIAGAWQNVENPGQPIGVVVNDVEDRLVVVREEGDLP